MVSIALFCYNRPEHLRQTVAALLTCPEASQTRLYVFSDGPKTSTDTQKVAEVRAFLQEITGFRDVILHLSETNKGLANSVIAGVSQVVAKHGSVIVMEDDLICTPDFLAFMNEALSFYQNDPRVFSVSGYLYGFDVPESYPHDVLLLARGCSYGWGTWQNRWKKADWQVADYQYFIKDSSERKRFMEGGEDLLPMLQKQRLGRLDSWAIRWTFAHFKHNAYNLHPRIAKVKSTGMDGSGTNFSPTRRWEVQTAEVPIQLVKNLSPDPEIHRKLRQYFRLSWIRKTINFFTLR